jgi:hypothetical protein
LEWQILVLKYRLHQVAIVAGVVILNMLAFVGYITTNLIHLVLPGHENINNILEMIFIFPMVVGVVGFGVWLLIKGAALS